MDVTAALIGQYAASLRMLRQAIERCPNALWTGGRHPRTTWRIAYHALFYAHLYMVQSEAAFIPWHRHRDGATDLWGADVPLLEPYTQQELLEYADMLLEIVEETLGGVDITCPETGYDWYPDMTKLEHEILSIRHLQGHVGQISERLMEAGIDLDWISRRNSVL
jgi:hypothetical protein